jgi:hypothetical protein
MSVEKVEDWIVLSSEDEDDPQFLLELLYEGEEKEEEEEAGTLWQLCLDIYETLAIACKEQTMPLESWMMHVI